WRGRLSKWTAAGATPPRRGVCFQACEPITRRAVRLAPQCFRRQYRFHHEHRRPRFRREKLREPRQRILADCPIARALRADKADRTRGRALIARLSTCPTA